MHRTLKEQGIYPYYVQKVQALESTDFPRRVIHCEWMLQRYRVYLNFLFALCLRMNQDLLGMLFSTAITLGCDENPHARQNKKSITKHYQKSALLRTTIIFSECMNERMIIKTVHRRRKESNFGVHFILIHYQHRFI